MAHPIPAGFHAITPYLVIRGAAEAIEFYQRAFGAKELSRVAVPGADGQEKIVNALLQIGDSRLFLTDEFPEYGGHAPDSTTPVTLHLYVTDADATFAQAVAAGATVRVPLNDAPWGDRYGQVVDPFGHHWSIGEHLEDVTAEQIKERLAKAFTGAPCS